MQRVVGPRSFDCLSRVAPPGIAEARFEKAQAEYDVQAADLSKAIRGLENAIQAMEASKPASLLAIRSTVENSLALATAMELISEQKRKAGAASWVRVWGRVFLRVTRQALLHEVPESWSTPAMSSGGQLRRSTTRQHRSCMQQRSSKFTVREDRRS